MHTRTQTRTHRLIPTHAGKTGPNAGVWSVSWAHPHSRGENCKGIDRAGRDNGSSPLTRGKHYPHPKTRSDRRLIPTHAGKTCLPVRRRRGPEAHPHSRGENDPGSTQPERLMGSSPLTRGKLFVGIPGNFTLGLIPTHAGKTPWGGGRGWPGGAHPHSRGENPYTASPEQDPKGSSPLTRGKRVTRASRSRRWGLIPTHAGKTATRRMAAPCPWAHPHSRGENNQERSWAGEFGGSSPLTRGKRVVLRHHVDHAGLIPTHAGKTLRAQEDGIIGGAHPHSRGENGQDGHDEGAPAGSSPLTRGKRQRCGSWRLVGGLIPTHAGKT